MKSSDLRPLWSMNMGESRFVRAPEQNNLAGRPPMFHRSQLQILVLIVPVLFLSCSADEGGGTPDSSTTDLVSTAAELAVQIAPSDGLSRLCPTWTCRA